MADKWIQLMSEDGTDNLFPTSKMDLLWINASPNSSFASQNIPLVLSTYSLVYIIYQPEPSTRPGKFFSTFVIVGETASLITDWTSSSELFKRDYIVSATGIDVTGTNGLECIPYKIYGIK